MFRSLALLAVAFSLQTQDATTPPANAHLKLTAEGAGVQTYRCAVESGFHWVFVRPEATLFDPATHQQVGKHSAGPTWHWSDGSEIAGKVLQTTPASDPANIPWLLLAARSTGAPAGTLADVKFVRRSDTQGGVAPSTGCDAEHANAAVRVPYKAIYSFYTAM